MVFSSLLFFNYNSQLLEILTRSKRNLSRRSTKEEVRIQVKRSGYSDFFLESLIMGNLYSQGKTVIGKRHQI